MSVVQLHSVSFIPIHLYVSFILAFQCWLALRWQTGCPLGALSLDMQMKKDTHAFFDLKVNMLAHGSQTFHAKNIFLLEVQI